jgi:hypothetical protein
LNRWNRSVWLSVGTTRRVLSATTVWAHTRRKYFGQLGKYQPFKKDLGHGICSVIAVYLMLSTTSIETCGLATGIAKMPHS